MYCRKCEKTLPEDATFCPYCGNEKLEEDPATEAAEVVEETAEETVEEVAEEVTEAVEEAEEAVADDIQTLEETAKDLPINLPEKKSGSKGIVTGLLTVIILLLAVAVALLAVKLFGGEDIPAVTDAPTVTETVETTVADDAELFPMEYTLVYPEGIDYTTLNIADYFVIGEYKGLSLTITTSSEITDEDIAEYIEGELASHSVEAEVTDRAAKMGDSVNIDFVGTKDGVAFEGGTATGSSLTIGAGGYIDGFEDGIIGMKVGETKTIDVTFPENYHSEDLAGKDAQFEITLNSITEEVIPEYNDAFVRENYDMDTTLQFEAYVKELLAKEREEQILGEKQAGLLEQVISNSTVVKFPEGVVEDYMFQQIDSTRYYGAMYYGMEYSEFVPAAYGISAAEYEAEVRKSSETAVTQELAIFAIAEDAGLEVTEADRERMINAYLEDYEMEDVESICKEFGISEAFFNKTITFAVVFEKSLNYLVENATFTVAE